MVTRFVNNGGYVNIMFTCRILCPSNVPYVCRKTEMVAALNDSAEDKFLPLCAENV